MKHTANLNLKKPDGNDHVNIADINENMDVLDSAIHKKIVVTNDVPPVSEREKGSFYFHVTEANAGIANDTVRVSPSMGMKIIE